MDIQESWNIPIEVIATYSTGNQDFEFFEYTEEELIDSSSESRFIDAIIHTLDGDVPKLIKLSFNLKFKDDKHYEKMMEKSEVVKAIMDKNGKYYFKEGELPNMKTPEKLINEILCILDGEAEESTKAINTVTDGSEQIYEGRAELANQLFNYIFEKGMKIPTVKKEMFNE